MWIGARNSRQRCTSSAIASPSAAGGRDARYVAYARGLAASGIGCSDGPATPRARAAAARAARGSASPRELGLADQPNSATPDVDEKALEAAHARLREPGELALVARHDAAPESDIDTHCPSPRALLFQAAYRGGRGHAVERHVDERRHAAGCGRARRGREAFPVGAARLVEVDVRVDDARQDHEVADVVEDGGCRMEGGRHGGDPAVSDVNVRRLHAAWENHANGTKRILRP